MKRSMEEDKEAKKWPCVAYSGLVERWPLTQATLVDSLALAEIQWPFRPEKDM